MNDQLLTSQRLPPANPSFHDRLKRADTLSATPVCPVGGKRVFMEESRAKDNARLSA